MSNSEIRSKGLSLVFERFFVFIKGGIPYILFQLALLVLMGLSMVRVFTSGLMMMNPMMNSAMGEGAMVTQMISLFGGFFILAIFAGILGALFSYGYTAFILRFIRHNDTSMSNAMAGFSRQGFRFLGVSILVGFIVAIPLILLTIIANALDVPAIEDIGGGIISVIAGTITWLIPYLIHDHPEVTALGIIKGIWEESKGHRVAYFMLFIPAIVIFIVILILLGIAFFMFAFPVIERMTYGEINLIPFIIFGVLVFVIQLFFTFYMLAISTLFYEHRVKKGNGYLLDEEREWEEERQMGTIHHETDFFGNGVRDEEVVDEYLDQRDIRVHAGKSVVNPLEENYDESIHIDHETDAFGSQEPNDVSVEDYLYENEEGQEPTIDIEHETDAFGSEIADNEIVDERLEEDDHNPYA